MSYRSQRMSRYGSRRSFLNRAGSNRSITNSQDNYRSGGSGTRRHDFISAMDFGSVSTKDIFVPNDYATVNLMRFKRSFSGTDNDTEPTATAGNNYQSPSVMNGSKADSYKCNVRVANQDSSDGFYLDVYMVAFSFWDAFVWQTTNASKLGSMITFNTTSANNPDLRGEVDWENVHSTLFTLNNYKNSKFDQHYLRKVGTVYVNSEDANQSEFSFDINQIPSKVKRSQTGMFYSILLHNESEKNGAKTLQIDATAEISFQETPSANRLPYAN